MSTNAMFTDTYNYDIIINTAICIIATKEYMIMFKITKRKLFQHKEYIFIAVYEILIIDLPIPETYSPMNRLVRKRTTNALKAKYKDVNI